jgi:hypothetical protein
MMGRLAVVAERWGSIIPISPDLTPIRRTFSEKARPLHPGTIKHKAKKPTHSFDFAISVTSWLGFQGIG